MKADKENWVGFKAKPGTYFVYMKTDWKSIVNEFCFSVYGKSKTRIEKIDKNQLPDNFINRVFTYFALKRIDLEKDLGNGIKMRKFDNHNGFGFLHFTNENSDTKASITVEISNSKNIRPCYPFTTLSPVLELKPMKSNILVYEALDLPYTA